MKKLFLASIICAMTCQSAQASGNAPLSGASEKTNEEIFIDIDTVRENMQSIFDVLMSGGTTFVEAVEKIMSSTPEELDALLSSSSNSDGKPTSKPSVSMKPMPRRSMFRKPVQTPTVQVNEELPMQSMSALGLNDALFPNSASVSMKPMPKRSMFRKPVQKQSTGGEPMPKRNIFRKPFQPVQEPTVQEQEELPV